MNIQELKKAKLVLRKDDPFKSTVYSSLLDTAGKMAKDENREITENDIIFAAKKIIKSLTSTIELVKEGKLVEQYKKEIQILLTFMPKEIDDEVLKKRISDISKEIGKNMNNIGKIFSMIKEEYGDSANMSKVSKFIKEDLK